MGASGERIGPPLSNGMPGPFAEQVCTIDPFCTFAQTKLGSTAMRAPFSGTITKWRVIRPNGTLWLQVLRRRDSGELKSLRESAHETTTSAPWELKSSETSLEIRKGDFLGIGLDDFGASSLARDDSAVGCSKGFVPGIGDGETASPHPNYSSCGHVLLYSAKLAH